MLKPPLRENKKPAKIEPKKSKNALFRGLKKKLVFVKFCSRSKGLVFSSFGGMKKGFSGFSFLPIEAEIGIVEEFWGWN